MLKLYHATANWSLFHQLIRLIYLSLFLPVLIFITKNKFFFVTKIIPRNSLLEKKRFNAFVSDIDLTIVILENYEAKNLLKYFISIKKYFPMLDIPEVYFESEFKDFLEIDKSTSATIVDVFWHIRKINWNLQKLQRERSYFEKDKIKRSIGHSFKKITQSPPLDNILEFKQINLISSFVSNSLTSNICFLSPFLETSNEHSLKIILNNEEFKLLNYLMPDQPLQEDYRELKAAVIKHEKLITIASIRIDEALGKSSANKKNWLEFLKGQDC